MKSISEENQAKAGNAKNSNAPALRVTTLTFDSISKTEHFFQT
jgi:hypothetical protein